MSGFLDFIFGVKPWLPGQQISGAMAFHDHFPDKTKHGVRVQRIRKVSQILKDYDRAVKLESDKSFSPQYNIKKGLIVGGIAFLLLCFFSMPIGSDVVTYGASRLDLLGGPMLLMNALAWASIGIFIWSGYKQKIEKVDRHKAYWKHERIPNHLLVHVLTEQYGLVPRYSKKDVIVMSDPIPLSDGKKATRLDFAPGWIPRNFQNRLPKRFKVKAPDNSGLLSPDSKQWPVANVPVSYWKFEYERPFRLTMGEIYMEDGRWSNRPTLVKNDPAGLYTGTMIFGGTGTGKSQSALLPYIFQILAWNCHIDSEAKAIDYLDMVGRNLKVGDSDDFNYVPLEEILKLSNEAYDKMQEEGKGFAFEKMFLVLFEPKGELHVDVRGQLKMLGRANDFVELGTDQIQIDKWRDTRQKIHAASMMIFGMWESSTLEGDLRSGLVSHMQPFWKSEIIRRFKAKDFESLGSGFNLASPDKAEPIPLTLKDFGPDSKISISSNCAVVLPGGRTTFGDTALSDIAKALDEATAKTALQMYSVNAFGQNDADINLFTGYFFKKESAFRTMGPAYQEASISEPVREAVIDCLGLLASATGVLETGSVKTGDSVGSGSLCDGLFRGLSTSKREGGLFPAFRAISLLPMPTVPEGDDNAAPDIPQLIAGDLNGKAPVDDDEERLLKIIRTAAPAIRRNSGESYDEYINRARVMGVLSEKRNSEFFAQFRKVCGSCGRLIDSGYQIQEAYEKLHDILYADSMKPLEQIAGDFDYETSKQQASSWQRYLRQLGYSTLAERANGRYDEGIRVGLVPIDASWNFGCWDALSKLIEELVSQIVSEASKKVLTVSYSEATTRIGTSLKIHCHRTFSAMNDYVVAAHRYFAVMTPATLGFTVRKIQDIPSLEGAVAEQLNRFTHDPVAHDRLANAWNLYRNHGSISSDLVDGLSGDYFQTQVSCNGTNQFNPLYQPDVAPESVSCELGAALTAGDKSSGESFWSDAYTTMGGQYIGICTAATGWVTFNDVLNCFMHPSFRARMLMMAEARLEEMKALFRRVQDPTVVVGPTVQVWGEQALAESQLAEREWELNQIRDMTGMDLGSGEWLSCHMDAGSNYSKAALRPMDGPITSLEIREMSGVQVLPESSDVLNDLGLDGLLRALKDAKAELPSVENLVLRKIVGAYLKGVGQQVAGGKKKVLGKQRMQISKTMCDSFLQGHLVFGLTPEWEFRPWKECLAAGIDALRVPFVPPLTPPPILGSQIQALQSIIEGYKNFDAVALKGDALKDAKTKGNIMISYMVKVFGLRSEGAIYSFSPRSRHSITFPTFDAVRTLGLVVVSRITETVYQDVGMLISRMAIQQFQRVIKGRAGRQKTLLYGTNDAPPRMDQAHQRAHDAMVKVLGRMVPSVRDLGDEQKASVPADAKGRLDFYVREVYEESQKAFAGMLTLGERERLNAMSQAFLRQVRILHGASLAGGVLPEAVCDRLVLEALAFLGEIHADRMGDVAALGKIREGLTAADPGLARNYHDDDVLRGMAVLANFDEVGYQVGKAYGRVFDRQVAEKMQRLFHQALGEYQGMLSFARMQGDTERLREEGHRGVEFVIARRDLLSETAVILDEPDFRRLGALVQDEVQKTVIPSTAKTDGDGGYLEVARAGMCFNIFATQFPNSLKKSLGEDFKRYLGNLLTWLCLMIPDPEDAELVVKMFGVEDENMALSLGGSLQGVTTSAEGLRGRTDDLNVNYDQKGERKSVITAHDLMGLEAMQGYLRWRDGQRTRRGKLYTTPAFVTTGQIPNPVNPYGPRHLLLRAEEKLSRKPNMVLSYKEATAIVEDHGLPWVEEPVVVLIQHRMMDMSKSVSNEESERDARMHANRAFLQVRR